MQMYSTLLFGVLMAAILFAPWPPKFSIIWLPLALITIASWGRTQKKISKRCGSIALYSGNRLLWRNSEWNIIEQPKMTRIGIRLAIRSNLSRRKKHLWIAQDSMAQEDWHNLNQLIVQYPNI